MKTDNLGIPRFSNRDLIDMIYSGHADKVHVILCDPSDDIDRFNDVMEAQGFDKLQKYIPLDVDQKTFDSVCQSEWFMPDKYKHINLRDYLSAKSPPMHLKRMAEELAAYEERGLTNLLRYMIYLVDFMRENGIVWGVGRGSSVASYVLYLIGVHRIDSVQYGLDWREFLR
jgi:DNA polymerase III alpha subunit